MQRSFDVAIVGLGAMGSAVAYHLARSGATVIGFDPHSPPHAQGSSHGESRIIRQAYFEGSAYVPLLRRAYELWHELEQASGESLLLLNGGLFIGTPDSNVVYGTTQAAQVHGLEIERLDAQQCLARYPFIRLDEGMVAVREALMGLIRPEQSIASHLRLAREHGAAFAMGTTATSWSVSRNGVKVETDRGTYHARHLVLAAGAWLPNLLPNLKIFLEVERQVAAWFASGPAAPATDAASYPVWGIAQRKDGLFYGFPDLGDGLKVAIHHEGETANPDSLDRTVRDADIVALRELLNHYFPGVYGEMLRATVCMYTNTPDGDFVVDHHPDHDRVLVVSACSGHGFKFASVIGELVKDAVTTGSFASSQVDVSPFALSRFA